MRSLDPHTYINLYYDIQDSLGTGSEYFVLWVYITPRDYYPVRNICSNESVPFLSQMQTRGGNYKITKRDITE